MTKIYEIFISFRNQCELKMFDQTYYCEEKTGNLKYFDLKYYESDIKKYVDTEWFKNAVSKVREKYLYDFETAYDDDDDIGFKEYQLIKSYEDEKSFPHISCFMCESQIGNHEIEFMKNKIENESLTKYNIEWYYLANGCSTVNQYITLPLMKCLFPNIKWYFCKTYYHSIVTNTNDIENFQNIPEKIGITKSVDHPLLVVDLTNYQIGMNLDYLSGINEADFISE